MAMSLVVPLFPFYNKEEIAISFGTGALVTSIALIATGFTQGMRGQIAYYQEAIIVQMAGMGTGPAALAWLNEEPDTVFYGLTILYTIVMAGYLFYTVAEQARSSNLVINCFLDDVPSMYGKTALKIANSIIIGVSLLLMALAITTRNIVNRRRVGEHRRHPKGFRFWRILFCLFIFVAETVLAILINLTMNEYGQFVSADDRAEVQAWQFGQIIPLMLLLGPFMDVIRSLMVTFVEWKKKRNERKRATNSISPEGGEVEKISSGDTDVESVMPKLVMPVIKEVHIDETDITEEIKEVGNKGEVKEVEDKESVKEEVKEVEEKESVKGELVEEEPKNEGPSIY
jgi:hypothetical protein